MPAQTITRRFEVLEELLRDVRERVVRIEDHTNNTAKELADHQEAHRRVTRWIIWLAAPIVGAAAGFLLAGGV